MSGNLLARSVHDLTAGAWFGGSLMGAVGLNGATAEAKDPAERTRLSSLGWKKWTPVQAGALGAHLVSLVPILLNNKGRFAAQRGVMRWSWIKAGVTAAGAGATLYSGILGKKVDDLSGEGARGATEPSPTASPELQKAQKQLRVVQWVVPVLSGAVIVLGTKHGELQRPQNLRPKTLNPKLLKPRNLKALAKVTPTGLTSGLAKSAGKSLVKS